MLCVAGLQTGPRPQTRPLRSRERKAQPGHPLKRAIDEADAMRRLLAQNGSSGGAPPVQSRVLRGVGSPERRRYLDRLAEKDREGGHIGP